MHTTSEPIDVFNLREKNREIIINSINDGFFNRERDIVKAKTEMVSIQQKNIAESLGDAEPISDNGDISGHEINVGSFKPRASMAITYNSHDYQYLLEKSWEKIQKESGAPISLLPPSLKRTIESHIAKTLTEEYHHVVPILDEEGVTDRCFGVMFYEEKGEYGFVPFMGFGGKMKLLTYADVYSAPQENSKYDKKIQELLPTKTLPK